MNTRKIVIESSNDYEFAKRVIERDPRSDKRLEELGNRTILVTSDTEELLRECLIPIRESKIMKNHEW